MAAWSFAAVGWNPWLVLGAALAAAWLLRRLYRSELLPLPARRARLLAGLRGGVAGLLVLMLMEPSCTRVLTTVTPAQVVVLVDRSQSMAVADPSMAASHRLDEAVALGLVEGAVRDTTARDAALAVAALLDDLPRLLAQFGDLARGGEDASRRTLADLITTHHTRLAALAEGLAGQTDLRDGLAAPLALLRRGQEALARRSDPAARSAPFDAAALAAAWRTWQDGGRELERRLRRGQELADAALVHAAGSKGPLAEGLRRLDGMSRWARLGGLLERVVRPAFGDDVAVVPLAMEEGLTPLDPHTWRTGGEAALTGETDFAAPLRALAQGPGVIDRVLILSDGRATRGGDAAGAVRALRARGTMVGAVAIGDPDTVRDAVVAAIDGADEVFTGETIRCDVRFRIGGLGGQSFDLVLERDGRELQRRIVQGNGAWQIERFEFPAGSPGVVQLTARLQPAATAAATAGGGLQRQVWRGLAGGGLTALTGHAAFRDGRPDLEELVGQAEAPAEWGDRYGQRLRGWVVPPQTGDYVFLLAADDQAQLWLGTDADPASRARLVAIDSHVAPHDWTARPEQRSAPVTLRAGQAYHFEVLHCEDEGGDHCAVAWQLPDQTREAPIPGPRLLPTAEALAAWRAAAAPAGEDLVEASLDNNQVQRAVVVHQDPLRVLIADQAPRWDARFLATLFERDRRVELVRRYRSVRLPRKEYELLPPTQEQLDAFDVVVLGDLRPEELAAGDQERLARFVAQRGGFLIALAGPRALPAAYSLGKLADLLPVMPRSAGEPRPDGARGEQVAVRLTADGATAPITAVLDDPALNRRLWPALPPLTWLARGVAARPAARVLLESDEVQPVPVLAVQRVGAGRVLYVGSDETWRWRDRLGDRVHQTFWLQAVRWGLGMRLRGSDPRLQVALDRALVGPGDEVGLRVRARQRDGAPAPVTPEAVLERLDEAGAPVAGSRRQVALAAVEDAPDLWHRALGGLEQGRWRMAVRVPHADFAGLEEVRLLHVRPHRSDETVELGADLPHLERLAAAGGGRAATAADAAAVCAALAEGLSPRTQQERRSFGLSDNWLPLLLITGLLLTEWLLRKRQGLP